MFGPVIEGERVRLEPPRPEHAPLFQRWFAEMFEGRWHDLWVGEILRQEWDARQEEMP